MAKNTQNQNEKYTPENIKRFSLFAMVTVVAGLIGEMYLAMGGGYTNCGEFEVIEPSFGLIIFLAFYAIAVILLSLGVFASGKPTKFPANIILISSILLNAVAFVLIGLHFALIFWIGQICL